MGSAYVYSYCAACRRALLMRMLASDVSPATAAKQCSLSLYVLSLLLLGDSSLLDAFFSVATTMPCGVSTPTAEAAF
jgi:hypothetical protein